MVRDIIKEAKEEAVDVKAKNKSSVRGKPNMPPFDIDSWHPKTEVGKKVKSGEIKDINQLFDKQIPILEQEIVDVLLPNMEVKHQLFPVLK